MSSPVLTCQEVLTQFTDLSCPYFGTHLLFSHRQQRYMVLKLIQFVSHIDTENQDDLLTLEKMWQFYHVLFKAHSQVEDEKIHPALSDASAEGKRLVDEVEGQHNHLQKSLQAIHDLVEQLVRVNEGARDHQKITLLHSLIRFAKEYHEHTYLEESKMSRMLQALPNEKQLELGQAIKGFFQARPDGKQLILGMRDVCNCIPGDKQAFDDRMPWFVRNVIFTFLAWDATYTEYLGFYPAPQVNYSGDFEKAINQDVEERS